ncbi:MAG: hypothetical protein AAF694_17410 [Bacteroidota bacterium]
MPGPTDAIIQEKYKIVQKKYEEFRKDPEARMCLWLLEHDEVSMIDAFFDTETTIHADYPDLFIKFEPAFEGKAAYDEALYRELYDLATDYRNSDEEGKIPFHWAPPAFEKIVFFDPAFFLKTLSEFWEGIPDLQDYVVAYFTPKSVTDFQEFKEWMKESLESEWENKVRFMLLDSITQPRYLDLAEEFSVRVKVVEPELNMDQAMKDISNAAGSPDDPGTQYRNHFIDLTKAGAKGEMKEARAAGDKAIKICIDQNWPHLQISVLFALGAAWMNQQEPEKSLVEYDEAEKLARAEKNQGNQLAAVLLPNVLFAKAAAHIQMQEFELAATLYKGIPEHLGENYRQSLEAWRMAGFCYDTHGAVVEAYDAYTKALEVTDQMEAEQVKDSTLPYVGEALIRLDKELEDGKNVDALYQKLDSKLGKNWEKPLEAQNP